MLTFLQGFGLGASLIIAIGAQNAYVLSQGIKKNYHFVAAGICMIIDATLITLGVAGVGQIFASQEWLLVITTFGGALFLLVLAIKSYLALFETEVLTTEKTAPSSLKVVVSTTLAVSLLNPHVYLDTLVLLGSFSAQFSESNKLWFGAGAISASFIWFGSLAWFATKLAPIFTRPIAWKWLEGVIGTIMLILAVSLAASVVDLI